jgi:hypothetical protein
MSRSTPIPLMRCIMPRSMSIPLRLWTAVFFAITGLPDAQAQPRGYEGYQVIEVPVADEAQLEALRQLDAASREMEIWSEVLRPGPIQVRVSPNDLKRLDEEGIEYTVVIEDLQRHIDELYTGPRDGGFFDQQRTYDEIVTYMNDLVATYPDLAQMVNIGTSVEGRTLWAIRITGPGDDKPAVMYHGAQHGDVQTGSMVVAYVANHLLSNYSAEPEIQQLVDFVEWFILPIMNPDGYAAYSRYNANGVDLNRNWDGPGSGQDPSGGPYPFSEPETASMRDFFLAHTNVLLHVDFDGYQGHLMWPWGHTLDLASDDSTFHELTKAVHGLIDLTIYDFYQMGPMADVIEPVSGAAIDYTYAEQGLWSFAFELDQAYLPDTCEQFLPCMLFLGDWIGDCNQNDVPDLDDIAAGTSNDCNGNATPDECEAKLDCNFNDMLDVCEIDDGLVDDLNANGIPDECECTSTEQERLTAPDVDYDNFFGASSDLDGNLMVLGAVWDDGLGEKSGAAYVYRRVQDAWVSEFKLTASDTSERDYFGGSVAISGDTLVIGATGADGELDDIGAVYVFRFDGTDWIEEAKLTASDASPSHAFGGPVEIHDDVLVVGDPGHDGAGPGAGAAYVFRFDGNNWNQEAMLTASDAHSGDVFGCSLSVGPDTLLVGAWSNDSLPLQLSGAAYVFEFNGTEWEERQKLTASDADDNARFGCSLAHSETTAIIGANGGLGLRSGPGAAYVFEFDGIAWAEKAKLTASDGHVEDLFGDNVAFDGTTVMITAPFHEGSLPPTGAVYVYQSDGIDWHERARITASDADELIAFGRAPALDDGVALVTAVLDEQYSDLGRAVYIFTGIGDCNDNMFIDVCDTLHGVSVDWNENGVPDECECDNHECCQYMPVPPVCYGDVNGDGSVDPADVELIKYYYGDHDLEAVCRCDIDCDESIDPADVGLVKYFYGDCDDESPLPCWR